MIDLTRLNGHRMVLNCDLIRFAEAAPDTTITLVTGEKLIVRESCDELIERIALWRSQVLAGTGMIGQQALSAVNAVAATRS